MNTPTPTITEEIHREQENLAKFRRGLRLEDKIAFDDLWVAAYKHRSAAKYAGHLLTFETFLLCMQVEDHKEVMQVRELIHEVVRLRGEVALLRRMLENLNPIE